MEISIFADESGECGAESKYYLLTLVFHDQSKSIASQFFLYKQSISIKGLPDIAFHASPLLNGHDEYKNMSIKVKVYYDDGQDAITQTLHDALEYALSTNAILYRECDPHQYTLAQVADLLCTLELTALKYNSKEQTRTDTHFFGDGGSFKKN